MTVFEHIAGLERCVLCHEVGHLMVGRQVGFIHNAYIQFMPGGGPHRAVCHYSTADGSLESRVIRTLAGMVVQVKLCPTSIASPLRERLAAGKLFSQRDINDSSSKVRNALQNEGLDGDVQDDETGFGILDFVSPKFEGDSEAIRRFVSDQEAELHAMLQSDTLMNEIERVVSDVEKWIHKTELKEGDVPIYLLQDAERCLKEAA